MRLQFEARPGEQPYPQLPFPLPVGCQNLFVSYEVQPRHAVVEIGLFDAAGAFRGWSGAARSHFTVGREHSTPGYLSGPLPEGTWHIQLGLYQLPPEGVKVTVEVREGQPEAPQAGGDRAESARTAGWLKGDPHCHSHHSDARGSLAQIAAVARAKGLDFVAVTDHNTISHQRPWLAGGWGVIPVAGQEVSTYRGHFNVLGEVGWLDFRIGTEARLQEVLAEAGRRGGVRVLNHPKPCGADWEFAHWDDFDLVEVWNGPWIMRNWHARKRWHDLLCQGRRLPCLGGSDRHQPPLPDPDNPWLQLGSPTMRVWAEPTAEGILSALRCGRSSIGESPSGPFVSLRSEGQEVSGGQLAPGQLLEIEVEGSDPASRLRVITDAGVLQEVADTWLELPFPEGRFVRVEVYRELDPSAIPQPLPHGIAFDEVLAQERVQALSNPVFTSASL